MSQKESKSDNNLLKDISSKLDKLLVAVSVQSEEREKKIRVLSNAGFTQSEIQKMTGVYQTDISKILSGKVKKVKK